MRTGEKGEAVATVQTPSCEGMQNEATLILVRPSFSMSSHGMRFRCQGSIDKSKMVVEMQEPRGLKLHARNGIYLIM